MAENYVFEEVLGYHLPRSVFDKRTKFNNDDYEPTKNEIIRFQSRPNINASEVAEYSHYLADKLSLQTTIHSIDEIAKELSKIAYKRRNVTT